MKFIALAIMTVAVVITLAGCGASDQACNNPNPQACVDPYAQLHAEWAHSQ